MPRRQAQRAIRRGWFEPTHRHKKSGQYVSRSITAKDISTDQRGREKVVFTSASGNTWIMDAKEFEDAFRPYKAIPLPTHVHVEGQDDGY